MYKNKNQVLQVLAVSLLCSPMLQAMETQVVTTQPVSFPASTLCPGVIATCAAPNVTASLAKRYTAVRPIPTTTEVAALGTKTAQLIALKNLLAQAPLRTTGYAVEIPAFTQMECSQVQQFLGKFGYNVQHRWQKILSAQEISDNVLTERFITACEAIASEIEQFAQLAVFYKILELRGKELNTKISLLGGWGGQKPIDEILGMKPGMYCSSAGHSWNYDSDLSWYSDALMLMEHVENRMYAISSCLAPLAGVSEAVMFTTVQNFIKGDLTFFDSQTADFLNQAQNAHSFITVRSAAANSTATATAGDASTLTEVITSFPSVVLPKVLTLYADQFRRNALTKRFEAHDAHIFDLPGAQVLLQQAPGVTTDGIVVVVCQANSTMNYLGKSHTECGLGAAKQPAITDGYYANPNVMHTHWGLQDNIAVQTIHVKPVPTLQQANGIYHLENTGKLTGEPTLTHEELIMVQGLIHDLTTRYGQEVTTELVLDRDNKRISLISVRPYSTGNQTAPAIEPLSVNTDPRDQKELTQFNGFKDMGWYKLVLETCQESPFFGQYSQLPTENLTALLRQGNVYQEQAALGELLVRLNSTVVETKANTLLRESAIQNLVPKDFFTRIKDWFTSQPLLLQPELDKLDYLFNNIMNAMVNSWSNQFGLAEVRKLNTNFLEALELQQPAPGVVNSFSLVSVMDVYNRKIAFLENNLKPLLAVKKISTDFVTNRSFFLRAFFGVSEGQTAEQIQDWLIFFDDLLKKSEYEQAELITALKGSRFTNLYACWERSNLA